ncbi:hypothetical protein FJZ36_13685 [Candidatus Poribacteria bacterium]|nr:hypothetical protein [Candidatus Poribacteria bacterium]
MAYVIAEPCVDVKDTACVKVCPVDCIYDFEGERQLYIHPGECIDCGACLPECPVQAIFTADGVPDQWKSYIEANRVAFERHATTPTAEPAAAPVPSEDARPQAAMAAEGLSTARVAEVIEAVGAGTMDVDAALSELTSSRRQAAPRAATEASAAPAPQPRIDDAVPHAVARRAKIVPTDYRRVAPLAPEPAEPPLERPELSVVGIGAALLRLLQPVLGALRARDKYYLEGYASPSVFSASVATWSNAALNLLLYIVGARMIASAAIGEGWTFDPSVDMFLFGAVLYGIVEGTVRIWSATIGREAVKHRQYLAPVYGWLTSWVVWPIVEAMVKPAAGRHAAHVEPPVKAVPGGEVHFADELEKRRRYGLVHHVRALDGGYQITLELPRRTPQTKRKALHKLPDELPDYALRAWLEPGVVNISAELDDPRFAEVAGRDPGFPASFLTQIQLPDAQGKCRSSYDAATRRLQVWVAKSGSKSSVGGFADVA